MLYVLGNSYVNNKIKGFKYTEGATPYASHFRPDTPANFDEIMQMNLGKTDEFPTSTKIFYDAFYKYAGYQPGIYETMKYAAYDILEAAIYQAFDDPRTGGVITASDVYHRLKINNAKTPLGLVGFDADQISTLTDVVILQVSDLQSVDSAEIVAPSGVKTANLIYPMPTWDERVYEWSLIDSSSQLISVAVASVCTLLLCAIMITGVIFREELEFKMFNHWHIIMLCFAAIGFCWSAVLAWQGDVVQTQCDSYLWAIFIPGSFMLSLICFKAYRLSLIMLAAKRRKKMPAVTQAKVFKLALIPVVCTAFLLMIVAVADPPTKKKIIVDELRPKFDYHVCETDTLAPALLGIVGAIHILFSMFCVSAVREGGESFVDGMLMKEAFIIFYSLLVVLLILSSLDLDNDDLYVLRSVILCLAATGFCTQLLLARCLKHWLPERANTLLKDLNKRFGKPKINSESVSESNENRLTSVCEENDDFQAEVAAARSTNIGVMLEALKDPTRRTNFCQAAEKAFIGENTEFLCEVLDFKSEAYDRISKASYPSNEWAKQKATEINDKYCAVNAPTEINISSGVRSRLQGRLEKWDDKKPLLSPKDIEFAIDTLANQHAETDVFQGAFKEIGLMLYQNIWTKFSNDETALLACEGTDSVKVYSVKM
jgi:hypothetical protein